MEQGYGDGGCLPDLWLLWERDDSAFLLMLLEFTPEVYDVESSELEIPAKKIKLVPRIMVNGTPHKLQVELEKSWTGIQEMKIIEPFASIVLYVNSSGIVFTEFELTMSKLDEERGTAALVVSKRLHDQHHHPSPVPQVRTLIQSPKCKRPLITINDEVLNEKLPVITILEKKPNETREFYFHSGNNGEIVHGSFQQSRGKKLLSDQESIWRLPCCIPSWIQTFITSPMQVFLPWLAVQGPTRLQFDHIEVCSDVQDYLLVVKQLSLDEDNLHDRTEAEGRFLDLLELNADLIKTCERVLLGLQKKKFQVQVSKSQCLYLCDSLVTTCNEKFAAYQATLRKFREMKLTRITSRDFLSCRLQNMTFCVRCLLRVARALYLVEDLLSSCSKDKWWNTLLGISGHVKPPSDTLDKLSHSWSVYASTLRECKWAIDLVYFALCNLEAQCSGFSEMQLKAFKFRWSDTNRRLFLRVYGEYSTCSLEDLDAGYWAFDERQAEDLSELLSRSGSPEFREANPDYSSLIDFVHRKLSGPAPTEDPKTASFTIDMSNLVIKDTLGSGSYGTVAKYSWCGIEVAVKEVARVSIGTFQRETANLARVQHPNVVQLIGSAFFGDEGKGKLVMELMESDLQYEIHRLRCTSIKPPFPSLVAVDIMLQVAEAMDCIHGHRILHRDLKTKNILINRHRNPLREMFGARCDLLPGVHIHDFYTVKIADFGSSSHRPDLSNFTADRFGTLVYTAPEFFDDKLRTVYNWAVDVYSFGMVGYEILTGQTPFKGISNVSERVLKGKRPDGLNGLKCPAILKDLIASCWHQMPEKRPPFKEICKTLWQCKLDILVGGVR